MRTKVINETTQNKCCKLVEITKRRRRSNRLKEPWFARTSMERASQQQLFCDPA